MKQMCSLLRLAVYIYVCSSVAIGCLQQFHTTSQTSHNKHLYQSHTIRKQQA